VQLEGLSQLKNPVTSLGIELATFRLVAECLNQLRYRWPLSNLEHIFRKNYISNTINNVIGLVINVSKYIKDYMYIQAKE
jgi:hypothetical protein